MTCLERGGSFALLTFSIKAAVDMSSLRWQCDGLGSLETKKKIGTSQKTDFP